MSALTTPLKYVAHLNRHVLSEGTPPATAFHYIDISQVDRTGALTVPPEPVTFADAPSRARRIAPAGSTVISTVRTYLRAIAHVPVTEKRLVFSTGFAVAEPTGAVGPRFLSYACQDSRFVEEVVARSTGVSYPAINPGELGAISIAVPSLDEQRRIADFLDDRVARIDAIIAARTRQSRMLESAYDSFISERIDALRLEHDPIPLRRFALRIEQGWSPVAESAPAQGEAPGVVRLGSVRAGDFIGDDNKAFPEQLEPNESYRLHAGDLLVTRANTPALVGDAAVVHIDDARRLYLSDLIYRVAITDANPLFVSAALRAARTRQEIATLARGTSRSMAKLRGEDILNLRIPAAPLAAQSGLGAEDERSRRHLKDRRADLAKSCDQLLEYKQSLITAAVSGEIDVTAASARGLPVTA